MNYKNIITIESNKRGGKPCIRGMRMTMEDVLENLATGMTKDEGFRNSAFSFFSTYHW